MDTELFMECEEEELEPWQQVDDCVEEDDMDFYDSYCQPVEDSSSPLPGYETPPPTSPPTVTPLVHVTPPPCSSASSVMLPPPAPILSSSSSTSSYVTRFAAPPTPPVSAPPPTINQGTPLILTQTASGTFLLPAASGTGTGQPFLLTTQGFPGTPLVLNLQGQSVQPLTLIQSSQLGQLVRPNVTMSSILNTGQNRVGLASFGGATQSAPSFTAMKLPTTLTIRSSTPGATNLQMGQVGGANILKLASSPTLSSSSANGVTRVALISSSANQSLINNASVTTVTSALIPAPTKVVMSVEEFYYGTFEGDLSLRKPLPLGVQACTFSCHICSYLADNNLRLMQHMLQHSQLIASSDDRTLCRSCYRQFSSPSLLQTHQDLVHSTVLTSSLCRICEWAFENEPTFLNHMKTNHKPGEMPYICQVCSCRSSFYSDIVQHFSSFHRDSRFLLCIFCLKVTRNPVTYQDHLLKHQAQSFHCNKCRLQFITLKDKMQHKQESHRSFRRPSQLEGLPPGSKVTIRTYGKIKRPIMMPTGGRVSSTVTQPINIRPEPPKTVIQKNTGLIKSAKTGTQKPGSRHIHRLPSCDSGKLMCLECGTEASDFAAHYPTHVKCLLCSYKTCCSRAYAAHMIHHHVPRTVGKVVPLHRRSPPCLFRLQCSVCEFRPKNADHMAKHLVTNPEHYSATCQLRTLVEPDIELQHNDEQRSLEERGSKQNQDLPDPSWRLAGSWSNTTERDGDDANSAIVPFQETSGPHHFLGKNSDAIDYFNLLFPQSLVELITKETNNHAKICQFLGSSVSDWVPVTTQEIKGFIGLVILMGIQNLPDPSQYWSWNKYDDSYTFCRAMSFQRFKQIAANIHMGSFTSDEYCGTNSSSDPLHVFRPMLDIVGKAMWNAYQPNCCMTIDRALLPSLENDDDSGTAGNSKPPPQVWLLCDSKSGYCHRLFIQVGVNDSQGLGFTVVPELVTDLKEKHHQLYLANSLASVPLMQKLLDQGIYASSSFPPPNPILPRELWNDGQLEKPGNFSQKHFGPLLVTRWRDTKEMGCLSTNAEPGEADTVWRRSQTKVGGLDPIDRPMAFRLLQENMRGVDICKQLLACNPLGGVPRDRHWRSLFWFLVNLSIVNAFIILRESRKENPPFWVHGGLFMQVNFRKRLGNQLAKCAQKVSDTMERPSSHVTKEEKPQESVKQRHRMGKISSISKRCKNCNTKNVRRESVHGCVTCKVNLCKHTNCFWEFHGLSPLNRGSAKVGFLKDNISGEVEVDQVKDNMDDAMAPVEDMDFSDDDELDDLDDMDDESVDIQDHSLKEVKSPVLDFQPETNGHSAVDQAKERDDGFTARQLRIALFALCEGLCQASRVFSTEIKLIRTWLREAQKHLKQHELEQSVSIDGDGHMVTWVLSMREQQLPITESTLFHKASVLKKKGSFSDTFRISYNWAVSFMLQHRLGVRSVGRTATLECTLPASLDAKVKAFQKFTQRIVRIHKLSESSVAAMDELCLFVDMRLVQDESRRLEALEFTGTVPVVTVYLTALADGTMLPSLVLATRSVVKKDLPEAILLQVIPETLSAEEALDLWTNKIWLKHLSSGPPQSKSVLVLDRHREHMSDPFLMSISGSGTLPAVIPAGGSFNLQPLEICVKPVLQRFLLSRWAKFTAGKPRELEEMSIQKIQANVAQMLVDWVIEALTHLNKLQQVWKSAFWLSGLIPKQDEEQEEAARQKPAEIQLDLLNTLTETLLGGEALEENPPDVLEWQDEEHTQEEPEGKGADTSHNKQEEPEEKGSETSHNKQEQPEGKGPETSNNKQEEPERKAPETSHNKQEESEGKGPDTSHNKREEPEGKGPQISHNKQEEPEGKGPETSHNKQEEPETLHNKQEEPQRKAPETSHNKPKESEGESGEGIPEEKWEQLAGDGQEPKVPKENPKEDKYVMEGKKETEETMKGGDGREDPKDVKKGEEDDSEEEGKVVEEKSMIEVNKEKRETRIVIGEEVGDEWSIKSRTDGLQASGKKDGLMDKS